MSLFGSPKLSDASTRYHSGCRVAIPPEGAAFVSNLDGVAE